ncbi:poly(A) RNA polymerase GLD2 [Ditylenchus destructor]|nr:poly(A) RNA polymerase GLD2 [Ditylenchus destructor]
MGNSASADYDWQKNCGVQPNAQFLRDEYVSEFGQLRTFLEKRGKHLSRFNSQLWSFVKREQQDDSVFNWKEEIAQKLHSEFRQIFPKSKVVTFGSTINGCGSRSADLDVCLLLPCHVLGYDTEQSYAATCLRKFRKECLESNSNNSGFSLIESREQARVPMLRLWWKGKVWWYGNPTDKLEINVIVNGVANICSSHLIRHYSRIDERFSALCLIVKQWAENNDIGNAFKGTLNGFSLTLMVLHFLQVGANPPIMSNLQHLFPDFYTMERPVEKWQLSDRFPGYLPDAPKNSQTLGELLTAFFVYYEHFGFSSRTISIASGGTTSRCNDGYISIEEPFKKKNVARSVSHWTNFQNIQDEIEKAAAALTSEERPLLLKTLGIE